MKKLLIFCFVLLTGFSLFAGESLTIAVCSNLLSKGSMAGDSRTCKLLREYFKSELATHSGMVISQSQMLEDENMAVRVRKNGGKYDKKFFATLGKDVKANYICMLNISRDAAKKIVAEVSIYKADGTLHGKVSHKFDSVRSSDFVAILLAREAAVAIRGANPVDDANLERMKKELKSLSDEQVREQVRQNMDAVK